jgi:DNA-binding XRE family transcriptional regulator
MSFKIDLYELRNKYELTQKNIADVLGISRPSVVSIEKGKRELSISEIYKISDYLGLSIEDILADNIPDYEKYMEMILEILRKYKVYSKKSATKTLLAKLVYFADFAWFYDNLKSMSGMKYRRFEYGPVSDPYFRAIDDLLADDKISLKVTEKSQLIDLTEQGEQKKSQILSKTEIDLIDKIVKKWKDASTDEIVEFTHSQIPWQICRKGEYIPYELITQEEPDCVY